MLRSLILTVQAPLVDLALLMPMATLTVRMQPAYQSQPGAQPAYNPTHLKRLTPSKIMDILLAISNQMQPFLYRHLIMHTLDGTRPRLVAQITPGRDMAEASHPARMVDFRAAEPLFMVLLHPSEVARPCKIQTMEASLRRFIQMIADPQGHGDMLRVDGRRRRINTHMHLSMPLKTTSQDKHLRDGAFSSRQVPVRPSAGGGRHSTHTDETLLIGAMATLFRAGVSLREAPPTLSLCTLTNN